RVVRRDAEEPWHAHRGDEVEEEPVEDVEAPAEPRGDEDEPLVAREAPEPHRLRARHAMRSIPRAAARRGRPATGRARSAGRRGRRRSTLLPGTPACG